MYCPRCGTQNDAVAKFCTSCGFGIGAVVTSAAAETIPTEFSELDVTRQDLREEYEVLEELGRGGMAIVFKARERQLDREVAVKVLPFSLAFDREFVERFQKEARNSAKLEHPNIIPIYRVGRTGRTIYFVMKLLRGKPLANVLAARSALPPAEIRDILTGVCRALAYAHRSGVVHRDIKPDNIMFDGHGHVVVTDFGIAKSASDRRLTGTGVAIGTPHFMSPEQAKAQPLDGRSDIYSLGVVAYACLTGMVPFDGEDSFAIGYKHIMEPLPEPELRTPDQRELFAIIRKMMAKTPDARFQTADEVLQALQGAPVLSRVASGAALAPAAALPALSSRPTTPIPRVTDARTPRGVEPVTPHRSVAASLLIFLFVVGGLAAGGGYVAYRLGLLRDLGFGATDSTHLATVDTVGRANGAGAGPRDSAAPGGATAAVDSARGILLAPGTPGRLVVRGVPAGARVLVNDQLVRGTELELPPGTHRLVVEASGVTPWSQQVIVTPGGTHAVDVPRQAVARRVDPCAVYGPGYNPDSLCWDTRPQPQAAPRIPIPADAPLPRGVILVVKVSREGETIDADVYSASNDPTFDQRALDWAKRVLRWTPAQKNGEPVEAFVQLLVQAERQP